jgi:Mn2+/Fe2+ NRAMP family transporter
MRLRLTPLALLGPGLLVAATGVGAGDLLTASLAGSRLGLTLLWAAWIGAVLKWFLNEGVARWQMATGTSLLQGWADRLGQWIRWVFLGYLLVWTFFTGGALINACGVAGTGIVPLGDDLRASKIIWGTVHSVAGGFLVWKGGFRLFERLMAVFIGVMFLAVIATAMLSSPDWSDVARGLTIPSLPPGGTAYMLGVLGGMAELSPCCHTDTGFVRRDVRVTRVCGSAALIWQPATL